MPRTSNKNTHPLIESTFFNTQADVLETGLSLLGTLESLISLATNSGNNSIIDEDFAHSLSLSKELISIGLGTSQES